jgi:acetyl-CoA acetyltransferase
VGSTPYYPRGESHPQTLNELACKAILAAVEDAGLSITDVDGFAAYAGGFDVAWLAQTLGIPEIRYTAMTSGGGGGSSATVGLAASAIASGSAEVVVCIGGLQQRLKRYGSVTSRVEPSPELAFVTSGGLVGPGHMFALLTRRHMHLYGTRREHFAEVAISTRLNAMNRPSARKREMLTLDDYFRGKMVADPLCIYDFCLETDGAVACVVTNAERARDLRHPPAYVLGAAHGGAGNWGRAIAWMNMPDDIFASSGHRPVARRLYEMAGVGPQDIDVALLYDHFTSMVIMQLEDYGFCGIGEGGDFVAGGAIRFDGGSIPVNTHGGQLSEAYIIGMTHIREAVEQIRGTAINQVQGAELALVTGGPAPVPVSGLILRK